MSLRKWSYYCFLSFHVLQFLEISLSFERCGWKLHYEKHILLGHNAISYVSNLLGSSDKFFEANIRYRFWFIFYVTISSNLFVRVLVNSTRVGFYVILIVRTYNLVPAFLFLHFSRWQSLRTAVIKEAGIHFTLWTLDGKQFTNFLPLTIFTSTITEYSLLYLIFILEAVAAFRIFKRR